MSFENELAPIETDSGELDTTSPESMPTDGSGAATFATEVAGTTSSVRRIPTTFIVFGGIILAAGAGLFSMRALGLRSADAGTGTAAEQTVANFIRDRKATASSADVGNVRILSALQDEEQPWVPVESVQKNPFVIDDIDGPDDQPPPPALVPGESDEQKRERIIRERRKTILATGDTIEVSSILSGSTPVTMIVDPNDRSRRAMRLGEVVTIDTFDWTVESIEVTHVTFQHFDPMLRETLRVSRSNRPDTN